MGGAVPAGRVPGRLVCPFAPVAVRSLCMCGLFFNLKIRCRRKHSLTTPAGSRVTVTAPRPSPLQRLACRNPPLRACPSVEAEKHSVPVFDCSQMVPYTGSRWLNSMVDSSATMLPLRVSQQAGREGSGGQVNGGTDSFPGAGRRAQRELLLLVGSICGCLESGLGSNRPEFPASPRSPHTTVVERLPECTLHSFC